MLISSLNLDMDKRKAFLFSSAVLCGVTLYGQSSVDALGGASDAAQQVFDGPSGQPVDPVLDKAKLQVSPEFPGGQAAMVEFLRSTITYPEKEWEAKIQGTVYVKFVVAKDGAIRNIELKRGVSPGLDSEALRAVAAMPRWSPGTMDNEPVNCRFTLPVSFLLAKEPAPAEAVPDSTH